MRWVFYVRLNCSNASICLSGLHDFPLPYPSHLFSGFPRSAWSLFYSLSWHSQVQWHTMRALCLSFGLVFARLSQFPCCAPCLCAEHCTDRANCRAKGLTDWSQDICTCLPIALISLYQFYLPYIFYHIFFLFLILTKTYSYRFLHLINLFLSVPFIHNHPSPSIYFRLLPHTLPPRCFLSSSFNEHNLNLNPPFPFPSALFIFLS